MFKNPVIFFVTSASILKIFKLRSLKDPFFNYWLIHFTWGYLHAQLLF
jgi:hypothetical protein